MTAGHPGRANEPPVFVFVYGTLMRGEYHHRLLEGARFEREACTRARYRLMWMEYYPALLEGGATPVRGELFRVDAATLAQLDLLEEHPEVYVRKHDTLEDGSRAHLYVLRPEQLLPDAEEIDSGDFRDLPVARRRP